MRPALLAAVLALCCSGCTVVAGHGRTYAGAAIGRASLAVEDVGADGSYLIVGGETNSGTSQLIAGLDVAALLREIAKLAPLLSAAAPLMAVAPLPAIEPVPDGMLMLADPCASCAPECRAEIEHSADGAIVTCVTVTDAPEWRDEVTP